MSRIDSDLINRTEGAFAKAFLGSIGPSVVQGHDLFFFELVELSIFFNPSGEESGLRLADLSNFIWASGPVAYQVCVGQFLVTAMMRFHKVPQHSHFKTGIDTNGEEDYSRKCLYRTSKVELLVLIQFQLVHPRRTRDAFCVALRWSMISMLDNS